MAHSPSARRAFAGRRSFDDVCATHPGTQHFGDGDAAIGALRQVPVGVPGDQLGFKRGMVIQELGWDENVDAELRIVGDGDRVTDYAYKPDEPATTIRGGI